jgi:hypothetical protein
MRRLVVCAFLACLSACGASPQTADYEESTDRQASVPATPPHGGSFRIPSAAAPGAGSAAAPIITPEFVAGACSEQVTLHGTPGTVIPQAKIQFAYWGSYWTGTGQSERTAYDQAWSDLGNNPAFYGRLAEYSTKEQTIGTGTWIGSTLADGSLASGVTITEAQIQQELAAELAAGTVAQNVDGRIYVVMLPPGVTSQLDYKNNFAGHHSEFVNPAGGGLPIVYAVITYNPDKGYNDPLISHEISESITDPDLSSGWYDSSGAEIGDLCRFNYATLDSYTIEEIWSDAACACVGASTTTVDAGPPDTGTSSCTAPQWNAATVYLGGTTVTFQNNEYTAAYYTQNQEPDLNHGPPGSGAPWGSPVPCGGTACTPSCGGLQCGSDGCGGSCGTCSSDQACSTSGQCVTAACAPSCTGKQCGSDGCSGSCGDCPSGETCSSTGVCQSSVTQCGRIAPWDPNKPWYDYSVGEENVGSNNHLYSCKNVAYCIYDPTTYDGYTYGWTDLGPC